jgi:hypothetical protein
VARVRADRLRGVRDIEKRLRKASLAPAEYEHGAHALAVPAKTPRALPAFDAAREKAGGSANETKKTDDDRVPRNVDELRRELARRIDKINAGRDRDEVPSWS